MRLRDFIRQNREDLDAIIRQGLNQPDLRLNDDEREQWVMNDEGLYQWAQSEGWPG